MRSHQALNRWEPIPTVFAFPSWYTTLTVWFSRVFSTPGWFVPAVIYESKTFGLLVFRVFNPQQVENQRFSPTIILRITVHPNGLSAMTDCTINRSHMASLISFQRKSKIFSNLMSSTFDFLKKLNSLERCHVRYRGRKVADRVLCFVALYEICHVFSTSEWVQYEPRRREEFARILRVPRSSEPPFFWVCVFLQVEGRLTPPFSSSRF